MTCVRCRQLEARFQQLERLHAEALRSLRANAARTRADEYNRLRIAESDARLDREIAQVELEKHKQNHQAAT